jgi:alkylated DNA repair dioxygenase AlkB
MQQALFADKSELAVAIQQLPDSDLLLIRDFLPEADALFQQLNDELDWQQNTLRLFGKTVKEPRLSAWYGDPGCDYCYSGIRLQPKPWSPGLLAINGLLEKCLEATFNSVLANLYRDGKDSMGWHSDDEPELGDKPLIASVSLGAERRFSLRHKHSKQLQHIVLPAGSLLLMAGETQRFWQHQVAKTRRCQQPRINLTFRKILF